MQSAGTSARVPLAAAVFESMTQFAVSTLVDPRRMMNIMQEMFITVIILLRVALSFTPESSTHVQPVHISRDNGDRVVGPAEKESSHDGKGTPICCNSKRIEPLQPRAIAAALIEYSKTRSQPFGRGIREIAKRETEKEKGRGGERKQDEDESVSDGRERGNERHQCAYHKPSSKLSQTHVGERVS